MNRLSIGKGVCDDACAENAGEPKAAHKEDVENMVRKGLGVALLPHHPAMHYDWMDHHSIFETSEW
ncbi:hypothetical protein AB3X96_37115 [Paraburkholderia sp. BR13439]|uniref:hypothetical protein n=1 Tax=Paraburkholderia sp. BR13439 TaxID=3236996 RepID=UPI0034CF1C4C